MSQARIWTGSADFTSGSSTPFGIYDDDSVISIRCTKGSIVVCKKVRISYY